MQNNILPADFATKLMPTDNGKLVVTFKTLIPYVKAVLHYLQEQRISLNTADFVVAIMQSLSLEIDSRGLTSGLVLALYNTLIIKHYSPGIAEHEIYRDIIAWLDEQGFSPETLYCYKAIVTADYPMASTLNHKKIAVWRNTSKMGDWDKRQAVSVRKWIGSTLKELTAEQAERLAERIDERLASRIDLDVRHHSSYDFDAWERAYSSDKIRSCMNTNSGSEVGSERTFTCYCTGYHGLPDNGLNLTVLYQDGEPVARAITFEDEGEKYYIRSYGDDRLAKWLGDNDYEQGDFLAYTLLYTTERLIKPYVDGDICMADHHSTNEGKHYWVLASEGEYSLQTTDAYATYLIECECCWDSYPEVDTYELRSAVNGRWYTVCESCTDYNSYYVYTGYTESTSVFFHDGQSPDTNRGYVEYDGEYYETDSLGEYDLRLIDGEIYHEDDLYYCEKTNEYFTDSGDVYTDGEQISTDQPVHFPYECISREYWDNYVVECACGTLALSDDTRKISTPSLGSVITLDDYWTEYIRRDASGAHFIGIVFELSDIERDYDYDPSDKMQAFRDYAIAFNKIQYLRFQELGI